MCLLVRLSICANLKLIIENTDFAVFHLLGVFWAFFRVAPLKRLIYQPLDFVIINLMVIKHWLKASFMSDSEK